MIDQSIMFYLLLVFMMLILVIFAFFIIYIVKHIIDTNSYLTSIIGHFYWTNDEGEQEIVEHYRKGVHDSLSNQEGEGSEQYTTETPVKVKGFNNYESNGDTTEETA
jgi:hypothetical protein